MDEVKNATYFLNFFTFSINLYICLVVIYLEDKWGDRQNGSSLCTVRVIPSYAHWREQTIHRLQDTDAHGHCDVSVYIFLNCQQPLGDAQSNTQPQFTEQINTVVWH